MAFTMLPLKKISTAPLEQSTPLSQAAGSFGAPDDYAHVTPASQRPMHRSPPPLLPMAPPMLPMHFPAPPPPVPLSSLKSMPGKKLVPRSNSDWSDMLTIAGSSDPTQNVSLCGGVWERDSNRSLSTEDSRLHDFDYDGLFDVSEMEDLVIGKA